MMNTQWPYAIRRQRLIRKLTQQQLADMARVSRKTIAAMESLHQREPVSLTVWKRVTNLLGLAIILTPEPSSAALDTILQNPSWQDDAADDDARKAHRKRARPRKMPKANKAL